MFKSWLLYCILLFPGYLFAWGMQKDTVQPGTTTAISFKIENTSDTDRTYLLTVESPVPGIRALVSEDRISLKAHSLKIYPVPLRVAPGTPKGIYSIVLNSTDNDGSKTIQSQKLEVLGVQKLTLTTVFAPDYVKAGEKITVIFMVKNSGNTTEKLSLNTEGGVIEGDPEISLLPGESKNIILYKTTDATLGEAAYTALYLVAQPETGKGLDAYCAVKVIPIVPKRLNMYHWLPMTASLNFIGGRTRGYYQGGFQGEFHGKGSLDKENENLLEFHIITKSPLALSTFSPYERYFAAYERKNGYLHLGDKSYSASQLTEFSRYGRGAELAYTFNKITLGGFYTRPRFYQDIKDEFNIYSKYQFNRQAEITTGYVYKTLVNRQDGIHLPYLRAKTTISKNLQWEGEAAYSQIMSTKGLGFMTQVQGAVHKFNFNVRYLGASSEFAGYFSNSQSVTVNTTYRASKKISLSANYRQDARNYKRDTLYGTAPYQKNLQTSLYYSYAKKGSLVLWGGFQKYEDLMPVKQYNYSETFIRLNLNQDLKILRLGVTGQLGKTDNPLSNISGMSHLYSVSMGVEKFSTSISLQGSYAQTSRYETKNQKNIYYGTRLTSRLSKHSNLSIFYQNNYTPEERYSDRNLFEMRFHQQVLKNHELDLSGRYTLQRNQLSNKDFIVSLRYTLHLNVPVRRIAKYVSLSGTIANLGVKRTDGVRLSLGKHIAFTDKNGHYLFKSIVPGEHYLEIDRSTTEINDIADTLLSLPLQLNDKETIFNFGLTKAAKIEGAVELDESGDRTQYPFPQLWQDDKRRLESIIIEASNGSQVYRKMVAIGEKFDFTYLRPGTWKVKVHRNGLDKRYKTATELVEFTLQPDETKRISIPITRQQRTIKYQQQEPVKVNYENKDKE